MMFAFLGCKKSTEGTIGYGSSYNYTNASVGQSNSTGTFSFTKITIDPSPVRIGAASKLIATATGSNLSFVWSTSHGDLFGKGSTIWYSDSCIGEYSVTCVVSDGKQSATITVPIRVTK
jgi:hypothetical protein